MRPVRFSTRERRAPVKIDEIYRKNRFGGKDKKNDIFDIKEEEFPGKRPPKTRPRAPRILFSPDESLALMQFFVGEIQSKSEERLGRVAKRRVEIGDPNFWSRAKNSIGSTRSVTALRAHYHFNCRKLHEFEGLTIEEKLDLYYAMDIKVDKSIRKKLEETYGVEFDESGIITGSSMISHWDVIHPESDVDDEETESSSNFSDNPIKALRFSELEDGLMWQFVLDGINEKQGPTGYGKVFWANYQKKNAKLIGEKRADETLRGRFIRFLIPNLHKMPFDVETKAALFQSLQNPVPENFREKLIEETGVTIDEDGKVTDYPNRPDFLVLQSKNYEDVIGITSSTKLSTLRHPYPQATDDLDYSEEEDLKIWEYILEKGWEEGKVKRIKCKMSGWSFWMQFLKDRPMERTWKSLARHFTEDLMHNIMDTSFDLKTKRDLFFILSIPVDPETLQKFETIASEDVIGVTSSTKLSTPRHPYPQATDDLEYSEEEDLKIWEYILEKGRENGKIKSINTAMCGWRFWIPFLKEHPIERTWKSLARHVREDLMPNVMDTSFDLKTKLDLFYILRIPVDPETLQKFKTIATVILRDNSKISFMVPHPDFSAAPRKRMRYGTPEEEKEEEEEEKFKNLMGGVNLTSKNIVEFMDKVAEDQKREEELDDQIVSNSVRFPYLPWSVIRRKQKLSEKRESFWTRNARIRQLPPKSNLPVLEEKPSDLLGPSTRPVSDNIEPKVAAHQLLIIPECQQRIQERRSASVSHPPSNFVEEIKEEIKEEPLDYDHC